MTAFGAPLRVPLWVGLVVASVLGSSGACGAPPSAAPPGSREAVPVAATAVPLREVTLTVPNLNISQLPFYVGLQAGIFQQEGIELTVANMASTAAVAGLVDGAVAYNTAGASIVHAAASGRPVRLIAGGLSKPTWNLSAQSTINSVADLRGKRIGVSGPTTTNTLVTFEILAKYGVPKHELEAINLASIQGITQGLLAGVVDAGLTDPIDNLRLRREGLRVLLRTADEAQVLQGGLGTSLRRLQERPEEVEALLRGLLRATSLMHQDEPRVVDVLTARYELEPEVARELLREVVPLFAPGAGASDEVILRELSTYKEVAGLSGEIPVDAVTDFGPLQRAQRAVGP